MPKVVIKYVKSTLCRGLLSVGRTVYLTEVDGKIFEAKVSKVTKSSYEFEWENKEDETETTELSFINENGKDAEDVIVVQHGRIFPSDTECDLFEVIPNEADILASHTVCVLIPAMGESEPARYEQIDEIKYTKDKEVFSCKLVSNKNWVDVRSVYITEKLEEEAAATTTTTTTKKKKKKTKKKKEEEQQFAEGAWSSDENEKFESGVILHGWGKWDEISTNVVKSRSRAQVKSHAQKIQNNHPDEKKKLIEEHTKTTKKDSTKSTSKKGAAPKKKTTAPRKTKTTEKPPKPTRKSSKTSKQQSSTMLTSNSNKKRKTTADLEKESTDENDTEDGDEELVKAVSKENDDEQSTPGRDSIEHDFILSTLKKNMESLKNTISGKANSVLYDTFEREIKSCENKVVKLTQDVGLLEKIEKGLEALEKAGQALSANRRVVDKNKEGRAADLRTKKGKLVEAEEELVAARVRLGINAHNMQACALKLQNILTVRDQNQNIILQPTIDNKYINNDDDDDQTVDGNQTEVLVTSVEKGCQNFITKIEEALLERLESIKKDTVDTNFNIGFNKSAKSLRDKKEHYDHLLATANELKGHYKFRSSKKKEEFDETFASTTTAFEADYSRLKIKHKEALDAFDEAIDRLESVAWTQDETLKDILKITIGNISIQLELRDFDEDPIYLANDNEEDNDDDDNNNYDNTEGAVR